MKCKKCFYKFDGSAIHLCPKCGCECSPSRILQDIKQTDIKITKGVKLLGIDEEASDKKNQLSFCRDYKLDDKYSYWQQCSDIDAVCSGMHHRYSGTTNLV